MPLKANSSSLRVSSEKSVSANEVLGFVRELCRWGVAHEQDSRGLVAPEEVVLDGECPRFEATQRHT